VDFGNDSVYIAQAKRGGIDLILNENTNRKNPCIVSFQGKERFAGESASPLARSNYKNTIRCVKRLIGRDFDAPETQAELELLPFKTSKLEDGRVGIHVSYNDGELSLTCEAALGCILTKVKEIIAAENPGTRRPDIVMSVPGYFTDAMRRSTLDAVEIAGLNCLSLMNEHTATALAYGIYKNNRREFDEKEAQHVMFIDMGHSSYTACVVAFVQGRLQVKSACFDRTLGGRDFDLAIANHMSGLHKEKTGDDAMANVKARMKMLIAAEKCKKDMSPKGVTQATANVECLMNDRDFTGRITLEEFEESVAPLIARLDAPITQALAEAGIDATQLKSVEIVGGGSRVQCCKRRWGEILGLDAEALNYGLHTTLNSDEAVARGATLQCAILSPLFRVAEFAISDVVPFPIELSWDQFDASAMDTSADGADDAEPKSNSVLILQRGDETPKTRRVTFRRTEPFEVRAAYHEKAADLLPPGTSLELGKHLIDVPKLQLETEELPKLSVFVKHDGHGIFGVSSVALKYEVKPEPEPEPAAATDGADAQQPAQAPDAPAPEGDAKAEAGAEGGDGDAAPAEGGEGAGDTAPKDDGAKDGADEGASADKDAAADGQGTDNATESKEGASEGKEEQKEEQKDKEPKKPKKKYRKLDVPVKSDVPCMNTTQMNRAFEQEQEMLARDADIRATADKRNELETYIYATRDRLIGDLKDFADDAGREALSAKLTEAEDWLYGDEGFDSTKAVYTEKLEALQNEGRPLEFRKQESVQRPQATSELMAAVEEYGRLPGSEEEAHAHIDEAERETVRKACADTEAWLKERLAAQEGKGAHEDPAVTSEQITSKKNELRNVCRPIATKPKPLPPKKEKEEGDGAKSGDGATDGAAEGDGAADAMDTSAEGAEAKTADGAEAKTADGAEGGAAEDSKDTVADMDLD